MVDNVSIHESSILFPNRRMGRDVYQFNEVKARVGPRDVSAITPSGEQIDVSTVCGETLTATSELDQSHRFRCLHPVLGRYITLQTLSGIGHLSIAEIYVYVVNSGV